MTTKTPYKALVRFLPVIAALLLASGCAAFRPTEQSPAWLFFAFPTEASREDVLSMQWTYGVSFSVPEDTISLVQLSCDGIPESHVEIKGDEVKLDSRGFAIFHGQIVPVSKETTPWVYSETPMQTDCAVVVSREGKPDFSQRISVNLRYSGETSDQPQSDTAPESEKKSESARP